MNYFCELLLYQGPQLARFSSYNRAGNVFKIGRRVHHSILPDDLEKIDHKLCLEGLWDAVFRCYPTPNQLSSIMGSIEDHDEGYTYDLINNADALELHDWYHLSSWVSSRVNYLCGFIGTDQVRGSRGKVLFMMCVSLLLFLPS